MPCRPSAPPVSQLALFAASCSSRPRPGVIMMSGRCRQRALMKLIAYPTAAKTEERRVPERHDAGVAEDEIEREGEERRDRDLARELEIRRRRDERRERAQPERDLDAPPADVCLEMG